MTDEPTRHQHEHGDHVHDHRHQVAGPHWHGWHTPEEFCTGDDTFGKEADCAEQLAIPLPRWELLPGNGPSRSFAVVIPHVRGMLKPGVEQAVRSQASEYILADVSGSQYHYWKLAALLWRLGDFVLVEHDIVIPAGCLDGFEACEWPWCVHDYEVFLGGIEERYGHAGAFGCVRFRGEIMTAFPELVAEMTDRHWSHLDGIIAAALRARGPGDGTRYESHRHHPDAIHLHDYSQMDLGTRWATAKLHGVKA